MLRFVHCSDWHLPPPSTKAEGAVRLKQVLGRISWRSVRSKRHRHEVLQAAERAWLAIKPDRICVTGDLVNFAEAGEYRAAIQYLERAVRIAPVSLVPGNHDALVASGVAEQRRHWIPWLAGDELVPSVPRARSGDVPDANTAPVLAPQVPAHWPSVRVQGPAVFIGLSSAIPTPPFFAHGAVSQEQLSALEDLLRRYAGSGHFRVVMVHHPVQDVESAWRRGLRHAAEARAVLRRAGAELVLHGHLHRPTRAWIPGPDRPIPVFGAGSASLFDVDGRGHGGHFAAFELGARGGDGAWPLTVTDYFHHAATGEFRSGNAERVVEPKSGSMQATTSGAADVIARVE